MYKPIVYTKIILVFEQICNTKYPTRSGVVEVETLPDNEARSLAIVSCCICTLKVS